MQVSPGTLYLPSLFPHSLLPSSLFLTTPSHPLRPMVELGNCPMCPCEVVVEWRGKENQHKCIDHVTGLHRFNSAHSCPPHSSFHRPYKIGNIFLNTIHTHRNCNIFYFELIHTVRVAMHRLHFKVPNTNIADFTSSSTVLLKS
jgi:hypothetical protein